MNHISPDLRRRLPGRRQESADYGRPYSPAPHADPIRARLAELVEQVRSTIAYPVRSEELNEALSEAQSVLARGQSVSGGRHEDRQALHTNCARLLDCIRATLAYSVRSPELRRTMDESEMLLGRS